MACQSTSVQVKTWTQTPAGDKEHALHPSEASVRLDAHPLPLVRIWVLTVNTGPTLLGTLLSIAPVEASRGRKTRDHLFAILLTSVKPQCRCHLKENPKARCPERPWGPTLRGNQAGWRNPKDIPLQRRHSHTGLPLPSGSPSPTPTHPQVKPKYSRTGNC